MLEILETYSSSLAKEKRMGFVRITLLVYYHVFMFINFSKHFSNMYQFSSYGQKIYYMLKLPYASYSFPLYSCKYRNTDCRFYFMQLKKQYRAFRNSKKKNKQYLLLLFQIISRTSCLFLFSKKCLIIDVWFCMVFYVSSSLNITDKSRGFH